MSVSTIGMLFAGCFVLGFPNESVATHPTKPGKGVIELRVRDSTTGYAVEGAWVVDARAGGAGRTYRLPANAHLRAEVAAGSHSLEIGAPSYRSLTTKAVASPDEALPITVWLDPVRLADKLRRRDIETPQASGSATMHGFVLDRESGTPISGAQVSVGSARTETDERGFFSVRQPVPRLAGDALPSQSDLRVESAGHQGYVLSNLPLVDGDSELIVELRRGTGTQIQNDAHKLLRSPEELEQSQSAPAEVEPEAPPGGRMDDAAQVSAPPSSIRVGYNCTCANCSTVEVMSLETYVRRGLPREWIASWNAHSLRAGAIAYRSYGSYYVYHPLRPQYDICNTTCCQVNSTATSASTDSATAYTAGILLQRAGAIFRAEYSAENNNLGCGQPGCSNSFCTCGDGSAGSPGASWPCVAESVDSGHLCSGHGRGMCQWGSQRFALQGQLWNWIEDHYYNDNGSPGGLRSANMTSPLDIVSFGPDVTQVAAGDFFTIYISAVSYAELAHTEVMLGASLYSDATGYISDPTQDTKVTLYPGSNDVARGFNVPLTAPSGTYDLLVALWLDVDGDSAITSVDQPLVFYVLPAALTVM